MWQNAAGRLRQAVDASSSAGSSTKKKLFQGVLNDEEEQDLRKMMFPVLMPRLIKPEEFQTSQTLHYAARKMESFPVEDLQKTASSLTSELDITDLSDLTSDLDYLDITEDDLGDVSGIYDGSTSGGAVSTDGDTTVSAFAAYWTQRDKSGSGQGPLPEKDTFDLFLAKPVNESQIINISTDESILEVSKSQASDQDSMDI